MARLWRAWDGIFEDRGSVRAVCLLRILLGPVVLLHLRVLLGELRAGVYGGDVFHAPWVGWLPVASREVALALLGVAAVAAVLMAVGLLARLATVVAFLIVGYNLFLSETNFHHNRAFLFIVLGGVALLPCGKVLSVDAWWRKTRDEGTVLWPLWLLRFEHATTYFASGFSKLIDRDWWGGVVTWDRVLMHRGLLDRSVAPQWIKDVVTSEGFHHVFAKANVLTELFVATGLWFRATRLPALWVAIAFHLMIELTANVEVFSWLSIATLLVWVTPTTRERVLRLDRSHRSARILGAVVRRLDWTARFRVEDEPAATSAIRLTVRGGVELTGGAAVRLVLSRLPVTFFPCAPLRALDVLRGLGRGRGRGRGRG